MVLGKIREHRMRRELNRVLGGAEAPDLGGPSLRVLELLRDPEVSFEVVGSAIEWDPTLTVKLLGTVNSAAFAPKKPIEDVRHAVSYLGRGALESLVLAVAAQRALQGASGPGFDTKAFWRIAARRAALARSISDRVAPAESGESFTAALLLDCAVPVLANAFGERYASILSAYFAPEPPKGIELLRLERAAVGSDHAEAGALLAEKWGLSDRLMRAIRQQHAPHASRADLRPAVRLVVDEDANCTDAGRSEFAARSAELIGLSRAEAEAAYEQSFEDASELARTFAA